MSAPTSHSRASQPVPPSAHVVWHDLECGAYSADLPIWLELAAQQRGAVLEVGAGTGRVALALARAGHDVTALDADAQLLAALRARRNGGEVATVCADAREFERAGERFSLCVVPMHTVQLFGGAGRLRFLRCALAALAPGGLLACAILGRVFAFDIASGVPGPPPDVAVVAGTRYCSQATRVALTPRKVLIERLRRIEPRHDRGAETLASAGPAFLPRPSCERDVVELDRLHARALQREARHAGFDVRGTLAIAPTEEHAGGTVVLLGA